MTILKNNQLTFVITCKRLTFILCLFICSALYLFSQSDVEIEREELTELEQIENEKETIPTDTIIRYPHTLHGSVFLLPYRTYSTINKHDIQTINYYNLNDILENTNKAIYPVNLGNYGSFSSFSLFGGMHSDVAVNFNTRSINDISYGSLNLNQIAPDFVENFQILVGSDAVIFGDNSSSALINLQEIRYNTAKPYTRIWYSQSGNEFIAGDGIFSQNFSRDWNFNFGFRNMSSEGRYDNSQLNAWNIRTALRYSPSDNWTFSLSDVFTNYKNETNGGVLREAGKSIYNNIESNVMFPNLQERLYRHDVTLSASGFLAEDTTTAFSGSLYMSNSEWRRNNGASFIIPEDSLRNTIYNTFVTGINGKFEKAFLNAVFLRFGGDLYYTSLPNTFITSKYQNMNYSAFAHTNFKIADIIDLAGGVRLTRKYGNTGLSFGGSLLTKFTTQSQFFADLSFSQRLPSPVEGLKLKSEKNLLAIAEYRFLGNAFYFSANLFFRHTLDPILAVLQKNETGNIVASDFININDRTAMGGTSTLRFNLYKDFTIETFANINQFMENGNSVNRLPLLYTGLDISYKYTIGRSMLIAGMRTKFATSHKFYYFNPMNRSFSQEETESDYIFDGTAIYLTMQLGNAFVKISYENIVSNGYYYVSTYPMYNGHLKASIAWSFLD